MRSIITLFIALSVVPLVGCVTTTGGPGGTLASRVADLEQRVSGPSSGNSFSLVDKVERINQNQLAMDREMAEVKQGLARTQKDVERMLNDVGRLKEQANKLEDWTSGASKDFAKDLKDFSTAREGFDRRLKEISDQLARVSERVEQVDKTQTERSRLLDNEIKTLYKDIMGVVKSTDSPTGGGGGGAVTRGSSYTIQAGDTFVTIAHRAGVPLQDLKNANPDVKDMQKISVGQKIRIP